ncbi:hypothetical protein [Paludisphaera borealis]|uniref:Uncharacterized protein n=1 Tax=Paludisphaera borealis TaxID=1387353 RepID=A0A1U7CNF4_9BACT|nr:hypothetical protein [Paludisphaera borealis]APW60457.1 hypothetical protein BSF38_01927 [Paludisphaera borealis]
MTRHVAGRLERDGVWVAEEIEATIDRARISFACTKGEAWMGERHRLTAADGRIIEFTVDRKSVYEPDPRGDEEVVEGRLTADYRD